MILHLFVQALQLPWHLTGKNLNKQFHHRQWLLYAHTLLEPQTGLQWTHLTAREGHWRGSLDSASLRFVRLG